MTMNVVNCNLILDLCCFLTRILNKQSQLDNVPKSSLGQERTGEKNRLCLFVLDNIIFGEVDTSEK